MEQCYDWESNRLTVENFDGKFKFDLQLRERITVVRGESASGKTFLFNLLDAYKNDMNSSELKKYNTDNIFLVRASNKNEIKNQKGKLIIIDRGDLIIDDDTLEVINSDRGKNRFLIFIRKTIGLHISPNHYGTLVMNNETDEIALDYKFNAAGWV